MCIFLASRKYAKCRRGCMKIKWLTTWMKLKYRRRSSFSFHPLPFVYRKVNETIKRKKSKKIMITRRRRRTPRDDEKEETFLFTSSEIDNSLIITIRKIRFSRGTYIVGRAAGCGVARVWPNCYYPRDVPG